MEPMEQQFIQLLQLFHEYYFTSHHRNKALTLLDPKLVWAASNTPDIQHGSDSFARRAPLRDFDLAGHEYHTDLILEDICAASGLLTLRARSSCPAAQPVAIRMTAVCKRQQDGPRICQLHYSHPEPAKGAGLPLSDSEVEKLRRRSCSLQAFMDNLPGGVFRCLADEPLTIVEASDGFLSMFGYTRKEIQARFQDSFWQMIYIEDRRPSIEEVTRQLKLGNTKEIEYRVTKKDGSLIWVLDRGQLVQDENGQASYSCILLDITQQKKAQEELRLSLERHKIIMDQTADIVFEWDMHKDRLIFSGNWEKKFGYHPIRERISRRIPHSAYLHPDDVPVFERLAKKTWDGTPYQEEELRIANVQAHYIWCRIRATTQFNSAGKPVKSIGVILDIDAEKKMEQKLLDKAERDALTGLYNKVTAQNLVETSIRSSPAGVQNALLIMDVDNFKLVNDTLGHLFGDAVLTDIASGMKRLFRSSDLLGRVGGDEFIVYLKEIPSSEFACKKAEQIIQMIHGLLQQESKCVELSCSIGIAMYPSDGTYFQQLYHNADIALYRAKSQGKNCCVLYQKETVAEKLHPSIATTSIDSEQKGDQFESHLVLYVFRALYQSNNLESAVSILLEIVGKHFDVSRVYIFEDSEDRSYTTNTFEWCNEGIAPEKENLQHLLQDEMDAYYSNFNENDLFYCRDVGTLPKEQAKILLDQGIKSVLQCAIRDNGVIRGFVGFDECKKHQLWTQEQIDILTLVSEILSIFLLKHRAQNRAARNADLFRTLLDSQSSWIYAINRKTYELLFINEKTRSFVPDCRVGMYCYQAFFHRSKPCEICPAKQDGSNCSLEIYNPLLQVWTKTEASSINWDGQEACLLTCHDITSYKKPSQKEE